MYNKIRKLGTFIKSPFEANLDFFLFVVILTTVVPSINRMYYELPQTGIYWFIVGAVMSYLITLPLFFLKKQKPYRTVIYTLGVLNIIIDLFISYISNEDFFFFCSIILGTNPSEIVEFFNHFFTSTIAFWGLLLGLSLFLCFKLTKKIRPNILFTAIGIVIVLFGNLYTPIRGASLDIGRNIFLGKFYSLAKNHAETSVNLRDYYQSPQLAINKKLPQNIVIIIGESFSKHFSSLYGYEKNTNPKLAELANDSSLIVFKNVTSPCTTTTASIMRILSTFSDNHAHKEWFECLTLPEVLSQLKYKLYWISNQNEAGLWDNTVTEYARLCDSVMFVGNKKGLGVLKSCYDEVVLPPVQKVIAQDNSNKVIFVHLIGSHFNYKARYPIDRVVYTPEDYASFPTQQREKRSHYDNSIIYNDSIINSICNTLENEESIAFYFSDHGEDIFASSDNYSGHAITSDSLSVAFSKDIPFMVYLSDKYKRNYVQETARLRQSINEPFITDDFMYMLMDILNVRFLNDNTVAEYSALSKSEGDEK